MMAVKSPVSGEKSSALLRMLGPFVPPATRIVPLGRMVEVWKARFWAMEPSVAPKLLSEVRSWNPMLGVAIRVAQVAPLQPRPPMTTVSLFGSKVAEWPKRWSEGELPGGGARTHEFVLGL